MKRILKILIVFFLYLFSFIPVYAITTKSVTTFDPLPDINASDNLVYYIGTSDIKVEKNGGKFFTGVNTGNKAPGKIVYFKGDLPKENDYANVVTVTLGNAAYFLNKDRKPVYLNVIIKYTNVHIERFTKSDSDHCKNQEDKGGQFYQIMRVDSIGNVMADIWELHQNKNGTFECIDEYFNRVNNNHKSEKNYKEKNRYDYYSCHANVKYDISFTLEIANKAADGDTLPSEIRYPWKISDLDQSDKSTGDYKGSFTEAVRFNGSNFTDAYYLGKKDGANLLARSSDEYTKKHGAKFTATEPTDGDDIIKSTVLTYQNQRTASITWWGSGWVGTGIVGVKSRPNVIYTGNKCLEGNSLVDGTCGENLSLSSKPPETNKTSTADFNGGKITYTHHSSCKTKDFNINLYQKSSDVCRSVTLTVRTVLTEDVLLKANKLSVPQKFKKLGYTNYIMAGRAFDWKDENGISASVKHDVNWYYSYFRDGLPLFMVGNVYRDIDELSFYESITCTGARVNETRLKALVNNEVVKFVNGKSDNAKLSNKFKSVDPNNIKNKSVFMGGSGVKALSDETSVNGFHYENKTMLNEAYLDNTEHTDLRSLVTYEDKSQDTEHYDAGGKLYYIPIDYSDNSVSVSMNEANLSIIGNDKAKFSVTCSIPVKPFILDPPDNDGGDRKLSYRFRTIDVNNPFPKGKDYTPKNWFDWYWNHPTNRTRLANVYNRNPIYVVTLDKDSISAIKEYNKNNYYTDWKDMDKNGSSGFLTNFGQKFVSIRNGANGSYCKLGEFLSSCDSFY